jgi:chromosome segregation ATPase
MSALPSGDVIAEKTRLLREDYAKQFDQWQRESLAKEVEDEINAELQPGGRLYDIEAERSRQERENERQGKAAEDEIAGLQRRIADLESDINSARTTCSDLKRQHDDHVLARLIERLTADRDGVIRDLGTMDQSAVLLGEKVANLTQSIAKTRQDLQRIEEAQNGKLSAFFNEIKTMAGYLVEEIKVANHIRTERGEREYTPLNPSQVEQLIGPGGRESLQGIFQELLRFYTSLK